MAQLVKNLPAMPETWVPSLGQEDPLEEGMATRCSILAWRIPWTEEPGTVHSPQGCEELDTTDVTWRAHMHPRSLVMTSTLWWVAAMRFTFPGGELG